MRNFSCIHFFKLFVFTVIQNFSCIRLSVSFQQSWGTSVESIVYLFSPIMRNFLRIHSSVCFLPIMRNFLCIHLSICFHPSWGTSYISICLSVFTHHGELLTYPFVYLFSPNHEELLMYPFVCLFSPTMGNFSCIHLSVCQVSPIMR